MAIDMALSKAAVVVYDTGRDNRLPLDFVHSRRSGAPVLVVSEQASADPALVPLPDTLLRPNEMREWPAFTEAVKLQVMYAKERVQPSDLGSELSRLALEDNAQLLLTSLALLEGASTPRHSLSIEGPPGFHADLVVVRECGGH